MSAATATNPAADLAREAEVTRDELRAAFAGLSEPERSRPGENWVRRLGLTFDRFTDLVDRGYADHILDETELAEARGYLLAAGRALRGDAPFPERMSEFMLAMEAARHVLRDAADERRADPDVPAGRLAGELRRWLPTAGNDILADLAGVTPRTIERWLQDGGPVASDRLLLVHRLVAILVRSWTPAGVLAWFARPRDELGGAAPRDLLGDHSHEPALIALARAGRRSQGA